MKLLPIVVALSTGIIASDRLPIPGQHQKAPLISVETKLVLVPVTVQDRHGAFVAGLTREAFTVYDNGEPQTIQFFTSDEIPATVGLVIDCSGSMRPVRDEVTAAGTAFAASSHPLDEFFTVNFNERVWLGLPSAVDFAHTPEELRAALAGAPTHGRTAVYDALHVALDRLARGTRDRKVLIVVSDGGDNASASTLDSVLAAAKRANAIIYTVGIGLDNPDADPRMLKQLASLTGGLAFKPTRINEVTSAFTRIAEDVRRGYTIGFSPADTKATGFRTLRVTVKAPDGRAVVVRTRTGYNAGSGEPQ
jgi:VWFA-related protein